MIGTAIMDDVVGLLRVGAVKLDRTLQTFQTNHSIREGKMSYRNKVYLAFDGDSDIHYYYLVKAWKQNDAIPFDFYDAHDLNYARDTSQEESIKRQLLIRLNNSKRFVLLVGEHTQYLYKFVKWEIEQAIRLDLPIIVVNLNGQRSMDNNRCPASLKNVSAIHVSFNASILQFALENWIWNSKDVPNGTFVGPYFYDDPIYEGFGL